MRRHRSGGCPVTDAPRRPCDGRTISGGPWPWRRSVGLPPPESRRHAKCRLPPQAHVARLCQGPEPRSGVGAFSCGASADRRQPDGPRECQKSVDIRERSPGAASLRRPVADRLRLAPPDSHTAADARCGVLSGRLPIGFLGSHHRGPAGTRAQIQLARIRWVGARGGAPNSTPARSTQEARRGSTRHPRPRAPERCGAARA